METLQQVLTAFQTQSMEASQRMMSTFQAQSVTNMDMLLKQQADLINQIVSGVTKKPMTDTRGIGKPEAFKGDESNYIEWKTKLFAFLYASNSDAQPWVEWALSENTPISNQVISYAYEPAEQAVLDFDRSLYQTLVCCTSSHAFNVVHSASGSGLEAMRLISKRFEPRTPGTKRALLKAILTTPQPRRWMRLRRTS